MVADTSEEMGTCNIFMIVFLPAQSAHVTVIGKNVALDCGYYLPLKEGAQVLPIPNEQGGMVCIVL